MYLQIKAFTQVRIILHTQKRKFIGVYLYNNNQPSTMIPSFLLWIRVHVYATKNVQIANLKIPPQKKTFFFCLQETTPIEFAAVIFLLATQLDEKTTTERWKETLILTEFRRTLE